MEYYLLVGPVQFRIVANATSVAAAAAVRTTVATGAMPGQADEEAAVVTVVGGPVALRVGHEFHQVLLDTGKATFGDATVSSASERAHRRLLPAFTQAASELVLLLLLKGARSRLLFVRESRVGGGHAHQQGSNAHANADGGEKSV